jgi:hypothetical protein
MSTDRTTVVVGVDDSEEARSALRWAAGEARLRSARLKVVHALQPHHLAGVFGFAKLQPDATWCVEARRWLAEVVREEIGDVDSELELELNGAGRTGRSGARRGRWRGADRRRVGWTRGDRVGAPRFGELCRDTSRALPGRRGSPRRRRQLVESARGCWKGGC